MGFGIDKRRTPIHRKFYQRFGLPLVVIKTKDKANYFTSIQLANTVDIEGFIHYIAEHLVCSLKIIIASANGADVEEEKFKINLKY